MALFIYNLAIWTSMGWEIISLPNLLSPEYFLLAGVHKLISLILHFSTGNKMESVGAFCLLPGTHYITGNTSHSPGCHRLLKDQTLSSCITKGSIPLTFNNSSLDSFAVLLAVFLRPFWILSSLPKSLSLASTVFED